MKIFLVGGAVRDELLNLPIKDKDWVVVGATSDMMLKHGYKQVGNMFPVFLHPKSHEEYALARTERKNGKGYTGFSVWSTPDITLEEDLHRRDLTINAIAQDETGKFFDPYSGKRHIIERKLCHISDSFNEDPLRVLRVARFAAYLAHLNFRISNETQYLMKKMVQNGELTNLTTERIWKETEKALQSYNPQVYFQVLRECGALKILFPEINNLFGIPAPRIWHPEIDTGIHSLMTLTIAASMSDSIDVRFSTLFHDIGKLSTSPKQWPNHYGHGKAGIPLIKALCKRLHVPNFIRDLSLVVVEFHDIIHIIHHQSADSLIQLFNRIDAWRKPQRVEQIAIISESDARGRFGLENKLYNQGNYLRLVFTKVQKITAHSAIKAGFKGIELRKELTKLRIKSITETISSYKRKYKK